jgi:hypothetical protein
MLFTPEGIRSGELAKSLLGLLLDGGEERFGDGCAKWRLSHNDVGRGAIEWGNNDENKQTDSPRL